MQTSKLANEALATSGPGNADGSVRWADVPCSLCGATDHDLQLIDRVRRSGRRYDFRVVECKRCSFVYVTPRGYAPSFGNEEGDGARRDAATANRPIYTHGMAELQKAGLPTKARILDLGCAQGDFLDFASRLGHSVLGVDINAALADHSRSRGFSVVTGDIREIEFVGADGRSEGDTSRTDSDPDTDRPTVQGGFDAITLWDVIEHVDDPIDVLAACRRALRPGGLVFFHTGNAHFQIPKAKILNKIRPDSGPYLVPYQHISHFDPETAGLVYSKAGLEPESVFFAGTLHYPNAQKRIAMQIINFFGNIPPKLGRRHYTNAMGAIGRRVD